MGMRMKITPVWLSAALAGGLLHGRERKRDSRGAAETRRKASAGTVLRFPEVFGARCAPRFPFKSRKPGQPLRVSAAPRESFFFLECGRHSRPRLQVRA